MWQNSTFVRLLAWPFSCQHQKRRTFPKTSTCFFLESTPHMALDSLSDRFPVLIPPAFEKEWCFMHRDSDRRLLCLVLYLSSFFTVATRPLSVLILVLYAPSPSPPISPSRRERPDATCYGAAQSFHTFVSLQFFFQG